MLLLLLGLRRRLVRLISLVTAWRRRGLLLRLGRRRRARIRRLRVLRRVNAARAVERHSVHLMAQIGPLLGWGLGVRLVAPGHAGGGVSVVDGRGFVTAAGELLRVARVQRVDAVRADLALEASWIAYGGGWRCAGRGVGVCRGLLGGGFAAYDGRLRWGLLLLDAAGDEVEGCWAVGGCGVRGVGAGECWAGLVGLLRGARGEVALRILLWRSIWRGVGLVSGGGWSLGWVSRRWWYLAAIRSLLLLLWKLV